LSRLKKSQLRNVLNYSEIGSEVSSESEIHESIGFFTKVEFYFILFF